ncbi:MAG: DNA primase [Ignavibacteriae bacterium]|nr:DNA primase [Ignavibacteriota bacterium]MCB9243830.1 DNA primase [Ignavibacteriales bacterium]
MRIPPEKLDEIAQANDIIDIISSYTRVKKSGKSFLALCPFHPDKNPSMNVSPEKQVYHCFSCGASGNVYKFVQDYEKVTFVEAAQILADRAGIELNYSWSSPDTSNEISLLFEINKFAAKYFHNNLKNAPDVERNFVMDYLAMRRIKPDTVKKFGVGYATKDWEGLFNYFAEDNTFKARDVETAGLILKRENDKTRFYDRFRGRLIFPVFNESGKVVAFGGRILYEDEKGAKYINSPESKIYNKSKILYGLNFAKESIRTLDYILLVEGYMDVISLYQAGVHNVVASSGTSLTEDQARLISRYTKNVVLLFDSDFAGVKAARRGIEILLEAGLDLNIVSLPEGEDPDSIVNKEGKDGFLKHLNKKKSVLRFVGDIYEKEDKLSTPEEKTVFVKEMIAYISKMPDSIKRAFYVKEIASAYNLYESDLRAELEKAVKDTRKASAPNKPVKTQVKKTASKSKNGVSGLEEEVLKIFIKGDSEAVEYAENNLHIEHFSNEMIVEIVRCFLDQLVDDGKTDISKILNTIESEDTKKLITSLSVEKYRVSERDVQTKNDHFTGFVEEKINLKYAKDVLKKLEKRKYEAELEKLPKTEEYLNARHELSVKINQLERS